MRSILKKTILYLAKYSGLFSIARQATKSGLRILCYHGFEINDETGFRPQLFININKFSDRLDSIEKYGFPVLGLSEANKRLQRGDLPANALVITIDDGFYSVYKQAAGLLVQKKFPATVYVTTYFVQKETPIFRLVIQYMFWKSGVAELVLKDRFWAAEQVIDLSNEEKKALLIMDVIEYGENSCNEMRREEISVELGELLDVDYSSIKSERLLSLMTAEELRNLAGYGLDIQLHTHRHCFPPDREGALREIQENRSALQEIAGIGKLEHFCYPSGIYSMEQWPWLRAAGVVTATTCEPGLNYPETPVMGLMRFLDGNNIARIEFEAELFGFMQLLRQARNFLYRIIRLARG